MNIAGWIETEQGTDSFQIIGSCIAETARKLKEKFPEAGDVDMECTDGGGLDVTGRMHRELMKL